MKREAVGKKSLFPRGSFFWNVYHTCMPLPSRAELREPNFQFQKRKITIRKVACPGQRVNHWCYAFTGKWMWRCRLPLADRSREGTTYPHHGVWLQHHWHPTDIADVCRVRRSQRGGWACLLVLFWTREDISSKKSVIKIVQVHMPLDGWLNEAVSHTPWWQSVHCKAYLPG